MVNLNPDEICKVIRQKLETYQNDMFDEDIFSVGTVAQIGDGIARIYGLKDIMAGELLEFEDKTIGIALNLETENVGAVLMGSGINIVEGSTVRSTGKISQVPVGETFLGRVVDALARPLDGKGSIFRLDDNFQIAG